ncbi:MAG: Mov34/MPN/PAD-1 family protein [Candidatus Margulisiibacteriota bacterium]
MITLSPTHLTDIQTHACETYPDECCGALLGNVSDTQKITIETCRIDNQSQENKTRRFAITPDDYRSLEALAKSKQLTLLGFYHSHPDHPAQPSSTDLSFAWPFFSYLILAVEKGRPAQLNSFELDLDTEDFKPEALEILPC